MFQSDPKMHGFKQRTEVSGEPVEVSKKTSRYLELARNMAHNSPYGKLRHGAVLVKGGSVINASFNKDNFSSFGSRFRSPHRGHATVHAELGCILGISRASTSGADLYVCRINLGGDFRYSKPCSMCHDAMKHVGIKRVYYTTNNGTVEMYKL
tara:strand:+ start:930 stop:1388 length:459 start_codon:yes stop_codon:yes gene_type:complete